MTATTVNHVPGGAKRRLPPRARKLLLTVHVCASVGWIGVEAVLITLGVTGLTTGEPALLRTSYAAMGLLGATILVPTAVAALVTGVVLSLGTRWGLVRHWWVTAKLAITAVMVAGSTFGLNPTLQEAAHQAAALTGEAVTSADLGGLRFEVAFLPVLALVLLIAATALSTYKPWGLTALGRRAARGRQAAQGRRTRTGSAPRTERVRA